MGAADRLLLGRGGKRRLGDRTRSSPLPSGPRRGLSPCLRAGRTVPRARRASNPAPTSRSGSLRACAHSARRALDEYVTPAVGPTPSFAISVLQRCSRGLVTLGVAPGSRYRGFALAIRRQRSSLLVPPPRRLRVECFVDGSVGSVRGPEVAGGGLVRHTPAAAANRRRLFATSCTLGHVHPPVARTTNPGRARGDETRSGLGPETPVIPRVVPGYRRLPLSQSKPRNRLFAGISRVGLAAQVLRALQKAEGSNPFIRFA